MTDQILISSKQKKRSRVRFPIRAKITLPYLVLSLILAVAAAYLITYLVIENVEERFNKQLFEAGKISSELIVADEVQLLEYQRLLANVEGVPSAILSNDPNLLRTLTLGIIANAQLEAVEFLDLQGNHVLSMHHRVGGNPEEYEVSTGSQTLFSSMEIVQNILGRKSDQRGDKFADLVTTNFGDFLYVSGPVYDAQNDLAGVVLVGRQLPALAADIKIKTFAQISFYDRTGRVIYSTLPFPHALTSELAEQTILLKDDRTAKRDIDVANISFAEILGVWEVRGDNHIGVLGVSLSKNALTEISSGSRWRIFLMVAASNFLVILIGVYLATTITRPLLQLVQAAGKVAEGNLDIMIEPQSNDEVAVLTQSFNAMVVSLDQSHGQLVQSYDETLEGWAKALELRDKETEGHSERVTKLTVQLAQAIGIQGEMLVNIRRGALLHDIGKMGTPDAILLKAGPLDADERKIIQRHPQDAYDTLKHIDFLRTALEIPFCHHERWDGSGYPRGLRGTEIPISARIFAVVDVFDAMSSDRPYRNALPLEEVIKHIKKQSGSHFDPAVVDAFMLLWNGSNGYDA